MIDVEKMFFLERDKMTSVYERKEIRDLPETAYGCFLHGEGEILYITDEGKLYGICSIGDLERFYREDKKELEINRKYTFLKSVDYYKAVSFFEEAKTVNEIPVISEENELRGVITYEKEEAVRNAQRAHLKTARKSLWYERELRRFINTTRAKVLVYTFSTRQIWRQMNESERQILRERCKRAGDLYWCGLSNEEWEIFWKDAYEEGIVDTMRAEMEQSSMTIENGVPSLPDINGTCYHFKDGFRVTPNTPTDAEKKIYFYGPCIFQGAYCKDDQTIAYYLQNKLNENHGLHWKVVNRGLSGPDYCYAQMFTEKLSENDIVIVGYADSLRRPDDTMRNLILEKDMSDIFSEIEPVTDYLTDSPLHCNYLVNQKIAERIYRDICEEKILDDEISDAENVALPEKIQDYYINWDVHEYFLEYYRRHGLCRENNGLVKGAVIMNCNPFTKGHRYLIEQARGRVDRLYVFVVQEDKSSFAFQDRFRMVAQGVADLPDVQVIPSGKYILSKDTFAQYFEKENVQTVENMDYDLRIFGEVVAKDLGIQYRFVGEEPLDQVTRAYNETMKRILPEYGVSVVEIPRVVSSEESGDVISATRVRKALEEKDWGTVERLCPDSTVSYLKQMFGGENEMLKLLYTLSEKHKGKHIYLYGVDRDSVNVFTDLAYREIFVEGFVDISGRYIGSRFMKRPIIGKNIPLGRKDIIVISDDKNREAVQKDFPGIDVFYRDEILDVDDALKGKRVLLYGIGERGEEIYRLLQQKGISTEAAYVTEKRQEIWNGMAVHGIEELPEDSDTAVILAAKVKKYQEEMLEKLEGCRVEKYIDEFLPAFWSEQGDLFQVIHKAAAEEREIWLYGNDGEDAQLIERILEMYAIPVCGKVYEEAIEEKGIKDVYELAYEDINNITVVIAEQDRVRSQSVCETLDQLGFSMEAHNYTAVYAKASEYREQMKTLTDCLLGHVEDGNGRQPGYAIYGNGGENDLKILILGGSTSTDGHYRPRSWSYRFYQKLKDAGYNVTVYNGSACGYDIVQEMLRLLRDGANLRPDYVISMSGVNNIARKRRTKNQFSITTFIDWINALSPGKQYESGLFCEESLYDFWYRNTKILKMIAEFYGAKFYSFLQPVNLAKPETTLFETVMHEKRDMLENTRVYREKARQEKDGIYKNLIDAFDAEKGMYIDYCHYSDRGNEMLAEIVFQCVREEITIRREKDASYRCADAECSQ